MVSPSSRNAVWDRLSGWNTLDLRPSLSALVGSCDRLESRSPEEALSPNADYAGTVGDWREVCLQAALLVNAHPSEDAVRRFFERMFSPVRMEGSGQLTGYYEPLVDVRSRPDEEFSMAIRGRPDDLLSGDLGQFVSGLEGQRIMGRANREHQRFEPYRTRADIEAMDLGVPLAWGRPIDIFFLQIQGSGRLVFPDGHQARAAFAAHNGHPYVSIGRLLVERGELTLDNASKQDIEAWLERGGPDAWQPLFDENPRYVFFNIETLRDETVGPQGSHGVPLTPMASLAIDPRYHAYGVPVFVQAALPDDPDWSGVVITQDTGGAIQGRKRGDLFFGWGHEAGERAGRQNSQARWTLLLPKTLVESRN